MYTYLIFLSKSKVFIGGNFNVIFGTAITSSAFSMILFNFFLFSFLFSFLSRFSFLRFAFSNFESNLLLSTINNGQYDFKK